MARQFISLFAILALLGVATLTAPAQWTDGQSAEYVLGQPDFGSNSITCTTTGLGNWGAYGIAIDLAHGKLYVADISNSRVLRYAYPLTGNQPSAELVFGQADMTSNSQNRGGSPAANSMYAPWGLAIQNGDLWVAEYGNNRVLRFPSAWSIASNGPSANLVLGQPDFSTTSAGTSSSKMNVPGGLCVDASENLWVVDGFNNRVLKFADAGNKTSGASADQVLGQTDFLSLAAPDPPTSSSLSNPMGVCAEGTTLWVVDNKNSRVLRYDNAASKGDGAAADGVLGQGDFVSKSIGTTAATLDLPQSAAVDGNGRLYVGDYTNNRVLIFNTAKSKSNGGSADNVLGQDDMVTSWFGLSQEGFDAPASIAVDVVNGKLLVGEEVNIRVLQFSASGALPVQLASFTAALLSDGVRLTWRTISETNNYGFDVERRAAAGGAQWIRLGFLPGNGTSSLPHTYSYSDNLSSGKFFYRLKQMDLDGSAHYSESVSIEVVATGVAEAEPLRFALEQNYPNPFNPTTGLRFSVLTTGQTTLTVQNILGQIVATLYSGNAEPGKYYTTTFDASGYASGVYIAKLQSGTNVALQKMVMTK